MAKDKFKQMQQGGGEMLSSFQSLASTVAAIENQQGGTSVPANNEASTQPAAEMKQAMEVLYMRLPNPQIPINEYNLISTYCASRYNMTRQDWLELAIIEKLHKDYLLSDEEYNARNAEIINRPPRGQRKGMKAIRDGKKP